jgi:hypothetical protein
MTTANQEDIGTITSLKEFKLEIAKHKIQFAKLMDLRSALAENTQEIWYLKSEIMKLKYQELGGKLTNKEETKKLHLNKKLKEAEETESMGKMVATEWDKKLKKNEEKLNRFKQNFYVENEASPLQIFNFSQELSRARPA